MAAKCVLCGRTDETISVELGICVDCIRNDIRHARPLIEAAHRLTREELHLSPTVPHDKNGILCGICINRCILGKGSTGFCGIRKNEDGRLVDFGGATLDWHYEEIAYNFLPGYHERTLSVFYGACSFDCLFCQSWHFRDHLIKPNVVSPEELVSNIDAKTKAVYFHGGDPTPQINHAIEVSKLILKERPKGSVRINFETNGSMNEGLLLEMAELAIQSGGSIKFDIKAFNNDLHYALTGKSNEWTLKNFEVLTKIAHQRTAPQLAVASTPMITGYVDLKEIHDITKFIARSGHDIPYILVGFYPQFYMYDLPQTTKKFAEEAKRAAKTSGLRHVLIGNPHLLK